MNLNLTIMTASMADTNASFIYIFILGMGKIFGGFSFISNKSKQHKETQAQSVSL